MQHGSSRSVYPLLLLSFLLAGCARKETAARMDYQMGEKVPFGKVTYNVIESTWRTQLGDQFNLRIPEQRFLMISISVTNSSGGEISVPLFQVENANGKAYRELDNGQGVDNWFGLLRTIGPAQTQQGRILFDVPLSSYRLRLTDGGEPGEEKYTWVQIPLRMDVETDITPPGLDLPGAASGK